MQRKGYALIFQEYLESEFKDCDGYISPQGMALCFQECLESGYIDCHMVAFLVLDRNSFHCAGYRLCWVCS